MAISPIYAQSRAYLPKNLSFKGEAETTTSSDSTTKVLAAIAAVGSIGSLAASGLMLKKASDLEKSVKPVFEIVGKITAPIKEFCKNAEVDKVLKEIGNNVNQSLKEIIQNPEKLNVFMASFEKGLQKNF